MADVAAPRRSWWTSPRTTSVLTTDWSLVVLWRNHFNRCSSSKPSKARAPRARHHRPGSGSTPHDRRRASRYATTFRLASSRAPEQEGDVHPTSADFLQAPRPHPPPSSSPSKKHVVFIPADNTSRLRPRPPHRRSIRDLQIPIACAQPSRRPILPAVSSRRPRVKPRAPAKGRRPKPFSVPDGRS